MQLSNHLWLISCREAEAKKAEEERLRKEEERKKYVYSML
jgi:hypothetical protein